ncbi:MAG: hypothetical protein LUQ66_10630 [Methanoregula sp.]|nr:hypothetical protein [Methanoregula sp.]
MTIRKGQGEKWRQTTVVLREDILTKAQSAGIDINDLCNRALADATGIRYVVPGKPGAGFPSTPVIIVRDGAHAEGAAIPPGTSPEGIHPVINADDPRAATTVKQVPRLPVQKAPAALPGRVSSPEKPQEKAPVVPDVPVPVPPKEKPVKPETGPKKKAKGTPIKKFMADCIVREDTEDCHVTKDLLYRAFTRWCREHRIAPVPDRRAVTVALKNQFAMTEKIIGGEPSWTNLRLK